jgi:LAS superfamily LD-carboxypeptidase LdcB
MGSCKSWSRSVRGSLKNGGLTLGVDLKKPNGHNFYLSNEACEMFELMESSYGKKFASNIGGYRTYENQWEIFDLEYCVKTGQSRKIKTNGNIPVAKPGTSNHGWGEAIDVGTNEDQMWIKSYGGTFGWCHGESPEEPWHFTYDLQYCKK